MASNDVIVAAITNAAADKLRFISLNASWTWADLAQITDDAMAFGVCHSAYTAAQVEEALEAVGAIDLGDKLAQEKSNRLVREIGTFSSITTAIGGSVGFADGEIVKTKLNWLMSAGDTLNVWVRNSSGVIYVTGSAIKCNGVLWVKD